jgi:recombination protein RecR
MNYTKPLAKLIECFQKFPSIGPKSAQRMAFHVLKMDNVEVENLARAILDAKENIHYCEVCFNISSNSPCEICSDTTRAKNVICVVQDAKDLIAIEKTKEFRGQYHVLQGVLSPMDGIGVEDIRIKELLTRIADETVEEVIIALSPSVEGEATSLYLTKLIKPFNVKITRIAFGIPVGTDLEYADEITLAKALEARVEL